MSNTTSSSTMQQRREKGEGSVRYNPRLKKWEARLSYGHKANGKPDRRSKYADTEAAAKRLLKVMRDERREKNSTDAGTLTVTEYFEKWLMVRRLEIKENSFIRLREVVENHILPEIGFQQMCNVTADNCQIIIFNLIADDYSYSTIKKVYLALSGCFKSAMVSGDIVRSPMLTVKMPDKNHEDLPDTKPQMPFTDQECALIIAESQRTYGTGTPIYRLGWLVVLMLSTGLRPGEALGLSWDDVNWEEKTLHVHRMSVITEMKTNDNDKRRFKSKIVERTKTHAGNRVIGLNEYAMQALHELKKVTGEFRFIATNKSGGLITHRNFSKTFKGMLKTLSLQPRGLHQLRHTFATQLFAKGVPTLVISKLLGHASPSITEEVYIKVLEEQKRNAIQTIDFIDLNESKNNEVSLDALRAAVTV